MGNNSKEKTNNDNTNKEMSTKISRKINSNKNIINNINNIVSNNNNNIYLNNNKNTINQAKTKCKSISKFFISKNISNEEINEQNEIIREQESKEITPKKIKRFSVYKSSKANKYQINSNLPYVSTLGTQIKETIKKKNSNNCIGKYNIIPLVLPFIGVRQDEKKNKMI